MPPLKYTIQQHVRLFEMYLKFESVANATNNFVFLVETFPNKQRNLCLLFVGKLKR